MNSDNTAARPRGHDEEMDLELHPLAKHLNSGKIPAIHLETENCFISIKQKLANEYSARGRIRSLATPWRVASIFAMAFAYLMVLALISHRPFEPPARIAMLVAVFAVAAVILIDYALRGPERPRRAGLTYVGLLIVIATFEVWLPGSFGPVFTSSGQWIRQGAFCLAYSMLNGLPVTLGIILFDRHDRIAPHRRWLAGGAGAAVGLIALALHCPYDGVGHLLTAHAFSVVALVFTTVMFIGWLERRRHARRLSSTP